MLTVPLRLWQTGVGNDEMQIVRPAHPAQLLKLSMTTVCCYVVVVAD